MELITKVPTSADEWWQFITLKLREKPEWQIRVAAHIRAKTGHANPAAFNHNGASDAEKVVIYREIARAILENNPNLLQGGVAGGQAPIATEDDPPVPVNRAPAVTPPATPPPPPVRIDVQAPSPDENDAVRKLREALEAIGVKSKPAEIDPKSVEKLVSDRLAELTKRLDEQAKEQASKLVEAALAKVDEALAKLPPRAAIEIVTPTETRQIKGIFHWQFPQVLAWVESGVPLWLWSKAASGKTHLFRPLAEALGIKPWVLSCDDTLTVSKLLGFRAAGNGTFCEGLLYPPYKEGGLWAFDEIDVSSPAIACTNALLSNQWFLFPNGETVQKHPKFRVIAGANTKGTGAVAGYTARNRLDAATLDRFAIVELQYDEQMEREIACGDPASRMPWERGQPASEDLCRRWVSWVQMVRKAAGESVLVSPRASYNGVKALRVGIPPTEVAEALVFKLVTPDSKARLIQAAGEAPSE